MRSHINVRDHAMRVLQAQPHLRVMLMTGAVYQRHAPDPMGRVTEDARKTQRRDRDGEGKGSARLHEGGERHGRAQEEKGKGKDQAETTPQLLPKRIPEERSNEAGAINSWIKSTGVGRRVIYQATPRPQRPSDSRRSMGTGCTPTLALTFMAELGTTILGRGGGMTSRLCSNDAMAC